MLTNILKAIALIAFLWIAIDVLKFWLERPELDDDDNDDIYYGW